MDNQHEIQERSDVKKFHFPVTGETVRTLEGTDGNPWFVGIDVALVLGYIDTSQAIRIHCKCPELLKGVKSTGLTNSPRGVTIIPERDLYRLILRSKLPEAEQFEEWVVGEVLPTIRKTGGAYMTDEALEKILDAFPRLNKLHFCNLSLSVCRGLENYQMMFIVSIHDKY